MTFFAALILALSALFNMGAQAPITAPSQALTYEMPSVTTSPATQAPATQAPEAPSQALSQALSQAPKAPATQAPHSPITQAPVQAPCYEDEPCWDCATMGNLICGNASPQPTAATQCEEDMPCWDCATMGNLICGTAATDAPTATVAPVQCPAGTLAAEDGSCVNAHFYDAPEMGTDAPFTAVDSPCPVVSPLEGGKGAWAGAGTACQPVKGK